MKRDVQTSELVVLGLLILIAAYLFLVHIPVTNQLDSLSEREAFLEDQIVVLSTKASSRNKMKAAVDKAFADANGKPREIPAYNNSSVVTLELHELFSSSTNVSITFGTDKVDKTIVRRTIQINFTESSYETMIEKFTKISKSDNLYLITSMNVTHADNGSYTVSMSLTNFEYIAS